MKHLTLLIAAAAVVSGCSGSGSGKPQLSENTTIDVAGALAATEDLKVSDLGSKIHYIPLETNDSSLIGDRMTVKAEKDLIIFYPAMNFGNAVNPLPAFSITDGSFKGLIGHSGQDPEAFRYPTPCISADGKNVYFINPDWAVAGYTADGKFEKIYDTPTRLALGYVNDKTVGAIERTGTGQRSRKICTFQLGDTIADTTMIMESLPSIPMPANDKINMVTVRIVTTAFPNAYQTVGNMEFNTTDGIIRMITTPDYLYRINDDVHFASLMCDTIYNINRNAAPTPAYIFNMGEGHVPVAEQLSHNYTSSDHLLTGIIETPTIIVFGITSGMFIKDEEKVNLGVFDKRTGTTRMLPADKTFTDDLSGTPLPFSPVTATSDGKLIGLLTLEDMDKWREENPDAKIPAWMDALEEDANPVLVVIEP